MTDRYTVEVKNFGPIVDASVEMRPLTVFVGPSNTGKSYLAVLVYALHRCFGHYRFHTRRLRRPLGRQRPLSSGRPSKALRERVAEWIRQPDDDLPQAFRKYIRRAVEQADALRNTAAVEVGRCFGVSDVGELARGFGANGYANIGFRTRQGEAESACYNFELGSPGRAVSASARVPGLDRHLREVACQKLDMPQLVHGSERDLELVDFIDSFTESVFLSILGPIARTAYYLPTDRTGVMHSHKLMVGGALQGAASTSLRTIMLSGVLADFLDQLISVSGLQRTLEDRGNDAASAVEKNVLQGTIGVDAGVLGYPTFTYRPADWKRDIPMLRASSMVSELAPVVLYLRHLVQPGNVLIIEEPEAHLHPAMQAAFARELARLVHAGVRIVITTHSEWLLEQFANLVRLSSLPAKEQNRMGGEGVALNAEDVGAWFFKPLKRPKGSTVEELKLDPETGLFPTDYDRVSEALYNESARISNCTQEGVAK